MRVGDRSDWPPATANEDVERVPPGNQPRVEPAAFPGGHSLFDTMFVALHGNLTPHPWRDPLFAESDAYSLFTARSAAMGWLASPSSGASHGIWAMNDAGQDPGLQYSPPRVAWFQTALTQAFPAEQPLPVQAFLACAGDVIAHIGTLDLQAVHLLVPSPVPIVGPSAPSHSAAFSALWSARSWFADRNPESMTSVQVTLDGGQNPLMHSASPKAFRWMQMIKQDIFSCDTLSLAYEDAVVLEPGIADGLWVGPGYHRATFAGTLVEWSLDAVGWLAACLTDAVHKYGVNTPLLIAASPTVRNSW